jgi:hypothetical protein
MGPETFKAMQGNARPIMSVSSSVRAIYAENHTICAIAQSTG